MKNSDESPSLDFFTKKKARERALVYTHIAVERERAHDDGGDYSGCGRNEVRVGHAGDAGKNRFNHQIVV